MSIYFDKGFGLALDFPFNYIDCSIILYERKCAWDYSASALDFTHFAEVSLGDGKCSREHISFLFPACFAMCSSEPKGDERCSRGRMYHAQRHPLVVFRKQGHPWGAAHPAFKAQRPSGRSTSRLRKGHERGCGRPGSREAPLHCSGTRTPALRTTHTPPPPRVGQSSPSKALPLLRAWALLSVL